MTIAEAAPRIRPAHSDDIDALLQLETLFPTDAMSRRSFLRLLKRPSARVWVAERGGTVIGSTVLLTRSNSATARLYSLVVSPAARGHGVAARLIALAEAEAQRQGKHTVNLEVRTDNAPAIRLYRQLGYTDIGTLTGFYEDGSDALHMHHRIVVSS